MSDFDTRMTEIETRSIEIAQRMTAIAKEAEAEESDVTALNEELNGLIEERKALDTETAELNQKKEERAELLKNLSSGAVRAEVVEKSPEERTKPMEFTNMRPEEVRATEEYRSAFLKSLQNKPLNEAEKRANEMATTDVAGVIPTSTQEKIFNKLKQYAPLLSEITLLQVPGNVTFAIENANADAAKHAENAVIVPAEDTMLSVSLAGYEIVKVLRISKTVQAMAINAFESWLTDILGENIAAKIGEYIIYGDGNGDPKGIDYAQSWSDTTNAVIPAGAKYPTPAELVELVSYLKGGYHKNAKWLMNSADFWAGIVAAQSNEKYKILTDDYKRLLGYPILLDDNVLSGDIFFGDFRKCVGNLSQNITVDRSTESGFLYNSIDYRGSAIFDCDIAVGEAFVKCAKVLTAGA